MQQNLNFWLKVKRGQDKKAYCTDLLCCRVNIEHKFGYKAKASGIVKRGNSPPPKF